MEMIHLLGNLSRITFGWFDVLLPDKSSVSDVSSGEIYWHTSLSEERSYEPQGLHSEDIFGLVSCQCGALRGYADLGQECSVCETHCAPSDARMSRMGHIELPSGLFSGRLHTILGGWLLGITIEQLESVISYKTFIDVGKSAGGLHIRHVWSDPDNPPPESYNTGPGCIESILFSIDPSVLYVDTILQIDRSRKFSRQLCNRVIALHAIISSNVHPASLMTRRLPVLPAGMREIQPDGSALKVNNIYQCIINRSKRVKRLYELNAPIVILSGEQLVLQRAILSLPRKFLCMDAKRKTPLLAQSIMIASNLGIRDKVCDLAWKRLGSHVWASLRNRTESADAVIERSWGEIVAASLHSYVVSERDAGRRDVHDAYRHELGLIRGSSNAVSDWSVIDLDEQRVVITGVVSADVPNTIRIFTATDRLEDVQEHTVPLHVQADAPISTEELVRHYVKVNSSALVSARVAIAMVQAGECFSGAENVHSDDVLIASYTGSHADDLSQPHVYIIAQRASGKFVHYKLSWGSVEEEGAESYKARSRAAFMDRMVIEAANISLGKAFGRSRLSESDWRGGFMWRLFTCETSVATCRLTNAMALQAAGYGAALWATERLTAWEAVPRAVHHAQNASPELLAENKRRLDARLAKRNVVSPHFFPNK